MDADGPRSSRCCLGFSLALRERVVLPLQTLVEPAAALREGDFSIRARGARGGDPLGEVMIEVNALAETLRDQRLDALEATALLRKVMAEIDVAVFTFDERPAAASSSTAPASGCSASRPSGCSAAAPTSSSWPTASTGDAPRVDQHRVSRRRRPLGGPAHAVPAGRTAARAAGAVRRQPAAARGGAPGLAAADPRLGHELNNSLAPIKSIAGSLGSHRRSASRRRPTGATTCSAA